MMATIRRYCAVDGCSYSEPQRDPPKCDFVKGFFVCPKHAVDYFERELPLTFPVARSFDESKEPVS